MDNSITIASLSCASLSKLKCTIYPINIVRYAYLIILHKDFKCSSNHY